MKQLSPCPSSPNCVSTQAEDQKHSIAPFRYQKKLPEAIGALKTIVALARYSLKKRGPICVWRSRVSCCDSSTWRMAS